MGSPLQRKQYKPADKNPFGARGPAGTMHAWGWEYLEAMRVIQRTPAAVLHLYRSLKVFFRWCEERNLARPDVVTRPMLERFQRHLFYFRKKNSKPLTIRTQHAHLSVLRLFFRWMMRAGHLDANPASELILPRLPKRLPQAILSLEEVEAIFAQPNLNRPDGLRDRAMLEILYSSGLRRSELSKL